MTSLIIVMLMKVMRAGTEESTPQDGRSIYTIFALFDDSVQTRIWRFET